MLYEHKQPTLWPEVTSARERIHSLERRLAELTRLNKNLARLAHSDPLTGLGNRRAFEIRLDQVLAGVDRYGGVVSVIAIDLDGMKTINDSCGHPVGDRTLVEAATLIGTSVRCVDFAARLGGDEFAVVLPSTGADQARCLAERIRQRIGAMPARHGRRLTASLGVAAFHKRGLLGTTAAQLYEAADDALYQAKRSGRNTVVVYEEASDPPPAMSRCAPAR